MKKLISFIVLILALLTLVGCQADPQHVLSSYDQKECYYEQGFKEYTDYCKFYYNEQSIKNYEKQSHFKKVTAENIDSLKELIIEYNRWVKSQEYFDKYDFDYQTQIKIGDLFYWETRGEYSFDLYYVDFEKCILYFFHNNI